MRRSKKLKKKLGKMIREDVDVSLKVNKQISSQFGQMISGIVHQESYMLEPKRNGSMKRNFSAENLRKTMIIRNSDLNSLEMPTLNHHSNSYNSPPVTYGENGSGSPATVSAIYFE